MPSEPVSSSDQSGHVNHGDDGVERHPLMLDNDEGLISITHRRHLHYDEKGGRPATAEILTNDGTPTIKSHSSTLGSAPDDSAQEQHENYSPRLEENRSLQVARHYLYVSHTLNQFSEWSWQFCLVLFLAALTQYESLLFVSTYGVTLNGMVAYMTPYHLM